MYAQNLLEDRINEFWNRESPLASSTSPKAVQNWAWTPPTRKDIMFCDIECYRNFFYIGFKRKSDGKRLGFEFSKRSPKPDWARIRHLLHSYTIVTYNGKNYDMPMIALALSGATNDELKEASDKIIKTDIKWWNVEEEIGVAISKKIDHIDLFEPNPAVKDSLKTLGGRLHIKRLQDLPYHESTILTDDEKDKVADYCLQSDLDATDALHTQLKEALELRVDLGRIYGRDFRSMSDAQVGENIVKIKYEDMTGKRPKKLEKKVTSFKYKIPDFIEFATPELQEFLETIRKSTFSNDGKVIEPESWQKYIRKDPETKQEYNIAIGSGKYKFGIGGLHSIEKNRKVVSDDDFVLIDADVASQYPSIIMKLGLYPQALGPEFMKIYGGIIASRLEAKAEAKRLKPMAEAYEKANDNRRDSPIHERLKMLGVQDKGGKIQLNGVYGKLGSRFSVLYAPHLLISTTLTGQLTLLMMIEAAEQNKISIVSANTDGVIFRVPRKYYNGLGDGDSVPKDRLNPCGLSKIIEWWESLTSFKLEFAEYRAIYNRDVNCYMAIDAKGKAKRKGVLANHWHPDSPDYSPTYEMMKKNPQMTVCADAALEHILKGTDIREYITNYKDIRGFLTVVNATGGATWRDQYLGKVVRFMWSTDGDVIVKAKANDQGTHPKVSKTDGARPLMTLPDNDNFPDDIDYDKYVAEAMLILEDIRFYEPKPVVKPIKVTQAGAKRYWSLMRQAAA